MSDKAAQKFINFTKLSSFKINETVLNSQGQQINGALYKDIWIS